MARAPETGTWHIVVPVYEHAVGSGGNYRCTEVLVVKAASEEAAATAALDDTDEPWFACAVVPAEVFKAATAQPTEMEGSDNGSANP